MSWANDPPNPKVKDWNVTELKVSRSSFGAVLAHSFGVHAD